ncbi:chaplin [Nocardiopsis sp. MG754419]|uniref:chaplin n=1 Tax=Nocardiopsis sp. MG754419 TaxID=2259865 RepID=UPI001BA65EC7|nr:chaplin [Nocardiopsis sp. MG754419]MBR8744308.1 chaplin [Nocardiopsis sp. MG754419]
MRNTFRYSFATAMTAGLVLAPLGAAFADTQTDGSGGVGSGNQVVVPVDVEADLCGNSLAILGISKAECTQVSEVLYESSGQATTTDGSGGVASGNQIIVPVDAALDVCGNSVAVAGVSEAECTSVVEVLEEEGTPSTNASTDGSGGVGSGNQIVLPVDAAVDICGNSVAILGGASAKCTTIINIIHAAPENEGAPATDGSGGVASGNQVIVPVDAAVEICGNAVSVLGIAQASCVEKISEGEKPEKPEEEKPETPEEEKPETPEEEKPEVPEEKPETPEKEQERDEEPSDDKPAPVDQAGSPDLAVTGGALSGLVAAALAAVGAGGAGLYFARKRKAAAGADEE